MVEHFEVTWDGVLPGTAAQVWDIGGTHLSHRHRGPFTTEEELVRVYDRGAWGGPVTVVCHLFGEDADQERSRQAWQSWIDGVFSSGTVVG